MPKLQEINFQYSGVYYDYSTLRDCESHGCDSICRCGVIVDQQITGVRVADLVNDIYKIYFDSTDKAVIRNDKINSIIFGTGKEIDIYTIDRILRIHKIWDKDNWTINVESGYYGEEINSVTIDSVLASKIESEIEEALNIGDINDRIRYLLELEYGYLLPELDGCIFEVITIDLSDVVFGSDGHYQKIQKEDLDHYTLYTGIKGVVKKQSSILGDKYKIVDGYHRMYAGKQGSNVVKVILAKND